MSQTIAPSQGVRAEEPCDMLLPPDPRSARQARSAVRRALERWGMADPSGDTELLASELVANAVEHANGTSIGGVRTSPGGKTTWFTLALSRSAQRVVVCPAMHGAQPRQG
jgi:hypothetical protein